MERPWWRRDLIVFLTGVLSIAIVYWYETGGLTAQQRTILVWADAVFVLYFFADWLAMWKEHGWRRQWLLWNGWRLLGMIPLVIASFAFLRLLRLARLLAVLDHFPPVRKGLRTLKDNLDWRTLAPLIVAAGSITLGGAVLVWLAERGTNPRLEAFSEAVWWAVVTVTTVGYGDITPITRIGRLVAVMLMVTGIGTIGMLASQVSAAIIARKEEEIEEEAVAAAAPGTLAGQLSQLAALHDTGKLDDEEYARAKARLLGM